MKYIFIFVLLNLNTNQITTTIQYFPHHQFCYDELSIIEEKYDDTKDYYYT